MNKPFNAILNASEGPKWCDFCDRTGYHLTGSIALFYSGPGISFAAFDRESDFLLLFVNADYLNFYFLAVLVHLTWAIDMASGELSAMYQSIRSSQVNKSAKVGNVDQRAMANFSRFHL